MTKARRSPELVSRVNW